MRNSEELRERLSSFDAETEPEAFWDLLTEEATERVQAAFALVLLLDEDEEFVVYPGPGVEPDDLADLAESPTFATAIEAVGSDSPAFGGDDPDTPEPVFSAAVPVRIGGEVAGALAVERYEAGAFDQDEAATLQALVDLFAPALGKFFE